MFLKQSLSLFLSGCLLLTTAPGAFADQAPQSEASPPVQAAQQTPAQLQQLVAPIALYPDALVAQILAAATYPDQIVEADRWLRQHTDLKGQQLGQEVDRQPWDPSVKALTEFPSVLANMDKNLSWTSSLGDAYVNQQQEVMNAGQVMRDRAQKAGNLKSTSQEKVTQQVQTIVVEPTDPEVVYVPEYDPWLAYGEPIGIWPGWYSYPGLFLAGPGMAFGFGCGTEYFGSLAAMPARLVALIMEESPEDSPLAGSRASVAFTAAEASTEVEAFMAAEVTGAEVTGDSVPS